MKQKLIKIFAMATLLPAILNNAYAQKNLTAKLDSFFTSVANRGILSGAVLVSVNNAVVFKKGFGYASNEFKVKNETSTKFRLASLSKTVTSIAIMQLVQEGKIKVTDRISDILPWYPKAIGYCVTVQNLLMMNSGLGSYTSYYDFTNYTSREDNASVRDFVLRYCTTTALAFQPGSDQFSYSNTNYYILGAIIEQVTGESYEKVIDQKIFKPLDMTNSGYFSNTGMYDNMALGYSVEPVRAVGDYVDQTSTYSTGGLYSTVEDLFKLDQGLYTDKILKHEYVKEIYKNRFPNDNSGNAWLYGWQLVPNTTTMFYKTGILLGYRTLFLRDTVNHNSITILDNNDNENCYGIPVIADVLTMIAGKNPPMPVQQDICILMVDLIKEKGVNYAIDRYKQIKASKDSANWVISDAELFTVGQYLISNNQLNNADAIFAQLSADFPKSVYATYKRKTPK